MVQSGHGGSYPNRDYASDGWQREQGSYMSPTLIILLYVYLLVGGGGLIVFVRAACRTSEDWEQHPAVRQIELALRHTEDHGLREAKGGLPSRAG